MLGQPILWASIALLGGVVWARVWPASPYLFAGAVLLTAILLVNAWRRRWGLWWAASAMFIAVGALSQALHPPPPPVMVCGGTEPTRWQGTVDGPVERVINPVTREVRQRTALGELRELCNGEWRARSGRVSVSLSAEPTVMRGDGVTLRLVVEPFAAPLNPVGPDPRTWAHGRGLAGQGHVMGPHTLHHFGSSPITVLDRWRHALNLRAERSFDAQVSPLAKALLTGDRGGVDPDQRERWAKAGLSHLLAISGGHVATVAIMVLGLCAVTLGRVRWWVERGSVRRAAAVVALPAVLAFCVWVGSPVSAVRATIMTVAALGALLVGRHNLAPNALGLSALLILLWNPASLDDLGFILSFAAVAGLLLMPSLPPARTRLGKVQRWLAVAVLASIVSTVITLPFIASQMGQVSVVSPLTNLVAVPVGTILALPALLVWAPLDAVWPGVPSGLFAWPLQFLDWLATWSTDLPYAWVDVVAPGAFEWLVFAAGVGTALRALSRGSGWHWPVGATVLLIAIMIARALWPLGDGTLHVYHPYVGQGDSAVVVSPEGKVMVFDAGGAIDPGAWDPGRGVVAPWLRALGARKIDLAVVSHPDPDHLNGFDYLARNIPIGELWWSGAGEENRVMTRVRERVRAGNGVIRLATELPVRQSWGGIELEVYHPRPDPIASEGLTYYPELSDNNNSLVVVLRHGQRSAMLAGDLEREAEALLAPVLPAVDWVKAPHHGSRTSSTPNFVHAVRARVLVISCGVANRFNFPAPDVVQRWEQFGTAILRTDLHGSIEAVSDGEVWRLRGQVAGELAINSPPASHPR